MKTKFIINPSSIRGYALLKLPKIKNYFKTIDFVETQSRLDIIQQTRNALQNGYQQIVAVGGDGTVSLAANGFFENGVSINPDAILVVAKMGTGSDYFRTITNRQKIDWREMVYGGEIKTVDMGWIQVNEKDQYFLNMVGVGISAEVVSIKNKLFRWIPTNLKYIFSTLRAFFQYIPRQVHVKIGEMEMDKIVIAIFINKGKYAGGGMKLGPNAELDDGLLEVTVIEKAPILAMIRAIPHLYSGNLESDTKVQRIKTTALQVNTHRNLSVEVDGEFLGPADIAVKVVPHAIKIRGMPGH